MTLVESGAEQIIAEFGVMVKIYSQNGDEPQDSSEPVFFENTDNDSNFSEHKVRLYTTASEEVMKDYGLDETADAVMYSVDDIAKESDKVKYEKGGYTWHVEKEMTNQINTEGPYIHMYTLGAV